MHREEPGTNWLRKMRRSFDAKLTSRDKRKLNFR